MKLFKKILKGDRMALSQAITMIESKLETDKRAKRIAIAAIVFSAPLPISIGRGS